MPICRSSMRISLVIMAVVAVLAVAGCASGTRQVVANRMLGMISFPKCILIPPRGLSRKTHRGAEREGCTRGGGSTASGHWPAALGTMGQFWMPSSWSTLHCGVLGMDNGGIGLGGGRDRRPAACSDTLLTLRRTVIDRGDHWAALNEFVALSQYQLWVPESEGRHHFRTAWNCSGSGRVLLGDRYRPSNT